MSPFSNTGYSAAYLHTHAVVFGRIATAIGEASTICVTSHQDPDGDSVGTTLAMLDYLSSLGKKTFAVHHGSTPANLTTLPERERIIDVSDPATTNPITCDLVIALECPQPERMGAVKALLSDGVPLINIDHHKDNSDYGAINWVEPQASSVAEMVAQYFAHMNFNYGLKTATCLFAAILTDTGRFRFNNVSPITLRVAAELVAHGLDVQAVTDSIYYARSESSLKLTGLALSSMSFLENGRLCLIPVTQEMFAKAGAVKGDTEGVVEYTLMTPGVEIGAVIREETKDYIKASLRSRGTRDVSAIAREFGGGGHRNAAGLVLRLPFAEAINLLSKRLQVALHE